MLHQGVACSVIAGLVCAHVEAKFGEVLTLKGLGDQLQGPVWKHYKSWCRAKKVPGCGHRFTLTRFGRDAWNVAPELQSCYKAYTVKMLIYWLHAFLEEFKDEAPGGYTRAHTSYALAKMQHLFDKSGPFLDNNVKDDSVRHGKIFLLLYQSLAVANLGNPRVNFKVVPKYHSLLHLLLYVARTSRNPRCMFKEITKVVFVSPLNP